MLAADLVFLTKEGIVIGTPEKMRISPISLRQYSPKYDYLIRSSEKLSFSPAFFSFAFQCNLVKEAKLDAIILPQISIDTKINDINAIDILRNIRVTEISLCGEHMIYVLCKSTYEIVFFPEYNPYAEFLFNFENLNSEELHQKENYISLAISEGLIFR